MKGKLSYIVLFRTSWLLCCLLIGLNTVSFGQSAAKLWDFETWSSGQVKYSPHKKWNLTLEQQFRLKGNSTQFDRMLTEVETQFKPSKNFSFALGLRYIGMNDNIGANQGYENHFRFHLDATHRFKHKRFSFKNRLRYQNRNELGVDRFSGDYVSQDLRWKCTMEYNFKNWKLDPKCGFETFYHAETGELNGFTKNRLFIGTEYKLDKRQKLSFLYMRERETKLWNARYTRVVALRYTYSFKRKK